MNDYNIAQDITIDQYNLDGECLTMAAIYYKYADSSREAKTLVSEKTDNVKVVCAERTIGIREENSDKKLTVDMVNAMVEKDPAVIQAKKELREAEAVFDRISVMVKSLEIKKSELDNLVKLKCNSMYVDSPSKPTRDIQAQVGSDYMRHNMTPLPNKNA